MLIVELMPDSSPGGEVYNRRYDPDNLLMLCMERRGGRERDLTKHGNVIPKPLKDPTTPQQQ